MADYKITPLADNIDFDQLLHWDVVIVGAGPAGLVAGLTTAHRGLATLVIEAKGKPGGQPEFLYGHKRLVDVPGFPDGILGVDLSERVYDQALNARVQFRFHEEMVSIDNTEQMVQGSALFNVVSHDHEYACRKVIIACGLLNYPRKLDVLDALQSKKVYYRNPKIGDYEDHSVVIVGGGDSALDSALMVLERNGQVDLIVRSEVSGKADTLKRVVEQGGVVHTSCEITNASFADDKICLTLSDGEKLSCDLIIVQIGYLSSRDTFRELDLNLNDDGSIAVDRHFETSRPGIFAAGDVHGDIKLIPVAWAEGIQAAIHAFEEITHPYWQNEMHRRDHGIPSVGDKRKLPPHQLSTSPPARVN